ncbi:RutC family protein HI_0719 [Mannheimia haemolytica]|uniref:RutC family protein HI_0719 n=1 Tax=Mannheimia haemolytica TaxID=75985 RepID=A0A378N686_MANHA|nr:RutC family protein HI_0719 [Mannheimia haemolytica]
MTVIHTENAPAAIGPYVQAVDLGNMVLTSGQIPVNPETGEIRVILCNKPPISEQRESHYRTSRLNRCRYCKDHRICQRS